MSNTISIIKEAIIEGKSIEILYRNFNGESSKRTLSDIIFTDKFDEFGYSNEHIRAFCHKRQEERSFKIARISSIKFVDRPPQKEVKAHKVEAADSKQVSEGCYIATMVYGNYDHYQVMTLRGYRDNVLLKSPIGKRFVKYYYINSPKIVEKLAGKHLINNFIKKGLDLFIKLIKSDIY